MRVLMTSNGWRRALRARGRPGQRQDRSDATGRERGNQPWQACEEMYPPTAHALARHLWIVRCSGALPRKRALHCRQAKNQQDFSAARHSAPNCFAGRPLPILRQSLRLDSPGEEARCASGEKRGRALPRRPLLSTSRRLRLRHCLSMIRRARAGRLKRSLGAVRNNGIGSIENAKDVSHQWQQAAGKLTVVGYMICLLALLAPRRLCGQRKQPGFRVTLGFSRACLLPPRAPRAARRAQPSALIMRTRGASVLFLLASAFVLAAKASEEHAPAGPRDGIDTYFWNSVTNEVTWEVGGEF